MNLLLNFLRSPQIYCEPNNRRSHFLICLYSNVRDRQDNSKPKRWQSEALPSFGFYVLSKAYIAISGAYRPMAKRSLQTSTSGAKKAKQQFISKGWTQEYLANEVGIKTRQPIWRFLRDKRSNVIHFLSFAQDQIWALVS